MNPKLGYILLRWSRLVRVVFSCCSELELLTDAGVSGFQPPVGSRPCLRGGLAGQTRFHRANSWSTGILSCETWNATSQEAWGSGSSPGQPLVPTVWASGSVTAPRAVRGQGSRRRPSETGVWATCPPWGSAVPWSPPDRPRERWRAMLNGQHATRVVSTGLITSIFLSSWGGGGLSAFVLIYLLYIDNNG